MKVTVAAVHQMKLQADPSLPSILRLMRYLISTRHARRSGSLRIQQRHRPAGDHDQAVAKLESSPHAVAYLSSLQRVGDATCFAWMARCPHSNGESNPAVQFLFFQSRAMAHAAQLSVSQPNVI